MYQHKIDQNLHSTNSVKLKFMASIKCKLLIYFTVHSKNELEICALYIIYLYLAYLGYNNCVF